MPNLQEMLSQSKTALDDSRLNYLSSLKGAANLDSELTKTVQNIFKPDVQQLANQRGQAAADYYAAPEKAGQLFKGVFDPTRRAALRSTFIGNQLKPYVAQSSMVNTLGGSMQDLISGAQKAEALRMQGEEAQMGIAQQTYSDLLGEFLAQQQHELELMKMAQDWQIANLPSGGGGGDTKYIVDVDGVPVELTGSQYLDYVQGLEPSEKEKEAEVTKSTIIEGLNKLSSLKSNSGFGTKLSSFLPFNAGQYLSKDVAEYETTKDLVGQSIARLIESGRLSDADRAFYQNTVPTLGMSQDIFDAKMKAVTDYITNKLGQGNITNTSNILDKYTSWMPN